MVEVQEDEYYSDEEEEKEGEPIKLIDNNVDKTDEEQKSSKNKQINKQIDITTVVLFHSPNQNFACSLT